MIIIRPGPSGADYNDLYESGDNDNNPRNQMIIDDVKSAFRHAQNSTESKVDWSKVSLKFMRLENVSISLPIRALEEVSYLDRKTWL